MFIQYYCSLWTHVNSSVIVALDSSVFFLPSTFLSPYDLLIQLYNRVQDPENIQRPSACGNTGGSGMDTVKDCIDYFKDPELVARFQRSFGVVRYGSSDNGVTVPSLDNGESKTSNGNALRKSNDVNHTITNKFWYYLFLFGTYLGDEIGYAIVIPFLIWNIDSAVARKMVLVWAAVMYIGNYVCC